MTPTPNTPLSAEDVAAGWQGPGTEPHEYFPDVMMMGDCRVCGHTAEAHRLADTPQRQEGGEKVCECFGDSGMQASTHHDKDDVERCDLCGWPVDAPQQPAPASEAQGLEVVGWVSPKQCEVHKDAPDIGGFYLPFRKTKAGLFAQALTDHATASRQLAEKDAELARAWKSGHEVFLLAVDWQARALAAEAREAGLREALALANTHIQHMAAWISRTNASDTPLHGYSFEALGEDKWVIDEALKIGAGK